MSDLEVTYGTGGVSLVDWLQLTAENENLQAKLKVAEEKLRKRTQEFDEEMSDFLEGYGLILKENNELKERRDGPVNG